MKFVVVLCVVGVSASEQSWLLQRAENEESRLVFKNTTVTGRFMLASWSWRDSLAGMWDTSLRISLVNESFRNGHLQYRDGYGKDILRVWWHQSPLTNLTWKALFDSKFPPNSWNMSNDLVKWGYRPLNERAWSFYVDEHMFEAKEISGTMMTPLGSLIGVLSRNKRSAIVLEKTQRSSNFNLLDLFTGNGILAQIPQLFITLFSFITNLFPGRSNDYESGTNYATESDAEIITTTHAADVALMKPKPKF